MKKKVLISIAIISMFSILAFSSGTGGSKQDPLVTKNSAKDYINTNSDTYATDKISQKKPTDELLTAYALKDGILASGKVSFVLNDQITLKTGDKITFRTGSIKLSGSGSLINVTRGEEVKSPTALNANQTYVVAENSNFTVTVTSLSAKISVDGVSTYKNPYTIQYEKYADALSEVSLFRGTDYGYELDRPANRIESLVMLIRLLGEEGQALSYKGTHKFNDVPAWADSYVAYAFDKGYTKGLNNTTFGSNNTVKKEEYYTFLLRALKYKDGTDFNWEKSEQKAINAGIIDATFAKQTNFYRDQMSYTSYKTLFAKIKDSQESLADYLIKTGVLSPEDIAKLRIN